MCVLVAWLNSQSLYQVISNTAIFIQNIEEKALAVEIEKSITRTTESVLVSSPVTVTEAFASQLQAEYSSVGQSNVAETINTQSQLSHTSRDQSQGTEQAAAVPATTTSMLLIPEKLHDGGNSNDGRITYLVYSQYACTMHLPCI